MRAEKENARLKKKPLPVFQQNLIFLMGKQVRGGKVVCFGVKVKQIILLAASLFSAVKTASTQQLLLAHFFNNLGQASIPILRKTF